MYGSIFRRLLSIPIDCGPTFEDIILWDMDYIHGWGLFYPTFRLVFNFFYHHLKDGDHLVLSGVVRRALF